jgi:tripartite ATP-independent transporter DctM subunit
MGESVAALFLAGIVPGILIGIALMITIKLMANRYKLPEAQPRASWGEAGQAAGAAFWPLMTPVLLMGGIVSGVFTPTEAAAVAAGYSFVISIFILRTLKWSDLPGVLTRAGITSSVVMLLVGAAMAFKTVAALAHTPELLASALLGITENPLLLLLLVNLLLFIVGMFLDAGPAIIILGPILAPIFTSLGVDPVHFAIVMTVNLTIGLLTPPMGLVLFATSAVSGLRVETIARAVLPFLAVEMLVILLVTYIPAISLTLPRLAGFVN